MSGAQGSWGDLGPRVLSAAVMIVVAGLAIWQGGPWFLGFLGVVAGVMAWECARLGGAAPGVLRDMALPLAALALFLAAHVVGVPYGIVVLSLVSVGVFALSTRLRKRVAFYAFFTLVAAFALYVVRTTFGLETLLWLVGVVIVSDVLGYFAGRLIGGPKFWPKVSPKKTWSGTVAGWVGAAFLGLLVAQAVTGAFKPDWPLPVWLFSALLAFAAQIGDIVESALKRQSGLKDSSELIPGHGGVLDRFDGMVGATLAFFVIWAVF
ncbi:phosphatidate cytidylyltransferase [Rhodobacteraceae bacterium 63075]|nr:phosphatidate cytidylyltransferase [Rhodobacteraceae bacterium 63075]